MPRVNIPTLGSDNTVGGPGGSPLAPSVVSAQSLVWASGVQYGPPGSGLPCIVDVGGVLYVATTTFTSGASFGADGSNWAPLSSGEIGVALATNTLPASPFVNSTSLIPLGLSLTVPVSGLRPINVKFDGPIQALTNTFTQGVVALYEDGVQVQSRQFQLAAAAQFGGVSFSIEKRRSPAAGSHTYAVYGSTTNAANTWAVAATAAAEAKLQVVQV